MLCRISAYSGSSGDILNITRHYLLWTCVAGAHLQCVNDHSKIQIYRNEICLSSILNTNYTMQSTVGGVDVAMSKFNAQKYIMNYMDKIQGTHVPCVNNHNMKFEYKGMKTT